MNKLLNQSGNPKSIGTEIEIFNSKNNPTFIGEVVDITNSVGEIINSAVTKSITAEKVKLIIVA